MFKFERELEDDLQRKLRKEKFLYVKYCLQLMVVFCFCALLCVLCVLLVIEVPHLVFLGVLTIVCCNMLPLDWLDNW